MRPIWVVLTILLAGSPAISYFKYHRKMSTPGAGGQHYAVVDENMLRHALPNLRDLRIYTAGKEIPYVSKIMRGSLQSEQSAIRILQPGIVGGKTQLLLDMSGLAEYDRVTLGIVTKNYVAHALVDGQDDPHGSHWVTLGTTTLFDLSEERLGRNSTLQIPVSTYRYLRVTLDNQVKPTDILSASAGIERAQAAVWHDLSSEPKQMQQGKDTILTFDVPENVPVERVLITVDPAQGNFQRGIELWNEKGESLAAGEINRIHLQRSGRKIDVERPWLNTGIRSQGKLRAVIHNGDDASLKIRGALLQFYERRIYFDCEMSTPLELYYGDEKLDAPVYDYAQLFQNGPNAEQLQLAAEEANAEYAARPDERPWSERYPALLWAAILAAVMTLGGIAVKSIRNAAT